MITKQFETGEYAYGAWTCSDAITRETLYKVVKRTPKRVTLSAMYPGQRFDAAVTFTIEKDGDTEIVYDKDRYYARVLPAKESN